MPFLPKTDFNYYNLQKNISELETFHNTKIIFQESKFSQLLKTELQNYFEKKLQKFSVPIDMLGTNFQKKNWNILLSVPYGKTISYKQQAQLYGNEKSVRAVANANKKNKIMILIPCHRIINQNGNIGGYSNGIYIKKQLFNIENIVLK